MYAQNRRPAVGEGTNNQSTQQTPWSVLRKEVTMMMEQSRRPAGWLKVRIMTGSMEFYHPLLLVDIHFLGAISLQLFHIIGSRLHYHYGTLDPPPPNPLPPPKSRWRGYKHEVLYKNTAYASQLENMYFCSSTKWHLIRRLLDMPTYSFVVSNYDSNMST
jgi:hypothetical protein